MLVYTINLFFILAWKVVLDRKIGNGNGKTYCCIVAVQLIIISVFRDMTVGRDLPTYKEWFEIIKNTPISQINQLSSVPRFEGMEVGWNWINKFLSALFPDFRMVIVFAGVIFVFGMSWFIFKNSKMKWLSFYLFITLGYYTQSFSSLRQYLAIVLLLNGITFIKRRKFIRFLVVVVLASFIHKSALVFIPVYWLPKIKVTGLYWLFIMICSAILALFTEDILRYMIQRTKYVGYLRYLGQGSGDGILLMFLCFLFLIIIYIKNYRASDTAADIYVSLFIIAILLNIASLDLALIGRVMLYFHISLIILLPNTLATIKNRQSKYIATLAVCSLTFIYYFAFLTQADTSGGVPYRFM